jgi:hypothetical protein
LSWQIRLSVCLSVCDVRAPVPDVTAGRIFFKLGTKVALGKSYLVSSRRPYLYSGPETLPDNLSGSTLAYVTEHNISETVRLVSFFIIEPDNSKLCTSRLKIWEQLFTHLVQLRT